MSGDFIYSAGAATGLAAGSRKIERGLKRILILAAIILGCECVWLFVISPCIPLSTVEVRGFAGFDGTEALNYAGILEGASYISVNAEEAQKRLASHYLVESARVVKRFPDRLSIFLEPRRAVALALAPVSGRIQPLYIDKHGVVFRIGKGRGESPPDNLPVVSGLALEQPVLGMRLPAAVTSLFVELGAIGSGSAALLSAVSEIQIVRRPFDGFDLVLYPVHSPVRVRMGSHITEETLGYALLMLDVIASGNSIPDEIDFRSGMGAYKTKEARSGE